MGGMTCKTCQHEAREAIDQALVAGESNRRIAAQYSLSEASVRRHKDGHLSATLVKAAESRELAHGGKLTDQVEDILRELGGIAFGNIADVMSWSDDGVKLKNSEDLSPEVTALISEISETTTKDGGTIRIKFHNKLDAIEKVAKIKGYYAEPQKPDDQTALGAIIRLATLLSEAELRGMAAGKPSERLTIEGEGRVVEPE